jgi:secreted trypsin-like serine protease
MKTILTLSLIAFSWIAFAGAGVRSNLVGPTIESDLKDQVCLLNLKNDHGNAVCSAVRISKDYVLTAQHCARDAEGTQFSVSVLCNGTELEVEKVFESSVFAKHYKERRLILSEIDFSLIKLRNSKNFSSKFKLLKNFPDYQSQFLNSGTGYLTFAENTECEFHGFGKDKHNNLGNLNSTKINTSINFQNSTYNMSVLSLGMGETVGSPSLPDKKNDWLYSSARPGDSGGPLFCKAKTGEWILSGISSTWSSGECPEVFQDKNPKKILGIFKVPKISCSSNYWALPTKERLEDLFNISLED